MMSLWISALCRTTTTAMTVMPFVLILQLVMSGMIFDLKGFTDKVSYLMISKWGLNAICITANVNAMKLAPKSDDYLYEASNMLKMWSLPLIFAVVYIIIGALLLSLVDRDKRWWKKRHLFRTAPQKVFLLQVHSFRAGNLCRYTKFKNFCTFSACSFVIRIYGYERGQVLWVHQRAQGLW